MPIATGCWARCRTPRTRCRTRCSRPGAGWPPSRAAARCGPGCTGSPRTPACGWPSGAGPGCCRPTRPAAHDSADLGDARRRAGVARALARRAACGRATAARTCAEGVELAFVAALQHLPANQRAVLILREVLGFSAAEVGRDPRHHRRLGQQRAAAGPRAVDERVPDLPATGAGRPGRGRRRGWSTLRGRVGARRRRGPGRLLTEDVRFTMPPLPAWFDGREDVGRFLAERVFATPWRLVPYGQRQTGLRLLPDGQPTVRSSSPRSLRTYRTRRPDHRDRGFLDPALYRHLGLPAHPCVRPTLPSPASG